MIIDVNLVFAGKSKHDAALAKVAESAAHMGIANRIFAYGGYVRDRILGRKPTDIDMCLVSDNKNDNEAVAAQIAKMLEVPLHPRINGSGPWFVLDGIEFDFSHRTRPDLVAFSLSTDVTVNAMALSLADYHVADPLNRSLADLRSQLIRLSTLDQDWATCMHVAVRRVLRVPITASRLNFSIEENTLRYVRQNARRVVDIPDDLIEWEMTKCGHEIRRYMIQCHMLQFVEPKLKSGSVGPVSRKKCSYS